MKLKYSCYKLLVISLCLGLRCSSAVAEPTSSSWKPVSGVSTDKLIIKILPKRGCFHGDLDIALADVVAHPGSHLQVSIEPLLPEASFKPLVEEIKLDGEVASTALTEGWLRFLAPRFFKDPLLLTYSLPNVSTKTIAGLFICRVPKLGMSCRPLAYEAPQTSTDDLENAEDPAAIFPEGKIHFFKPLLLHEHQIFLPEVKEKIDNYWFALSKLIPNKLSREYDMDKTIWNFNLEAGSDYVQVLMPYEIQRSEDGTECR